MPEETAHQDYQTDITHLRRLATQLFTDGRYFHADTVLAELADRTEADRSQIALRRAQIGMLSDRMADVRRQLDLARDEYGLHVYYVGMEADMAVRQGDLNAAAAALRRLGRHSRADHLEAYVNGKKSLQRGKLALPGRVGGPATTQRSPRTGEERHPHRGEQCHR